MEEFRLTTWDVKKTLWILGYLLYTSTGAGFLPSTVRILKISAKLSSWPPIFEGWGVSLGRSSHVSLASPVGFFRVQPIHENPCKVGCLEAEVLLQPELFPAAVVEGLLQLILQPGMIWKCPLIGPTGPRRGPATLQVLAGLINCLTNPFQCILDTPRIACQLVTFVRVQNVHRSPMR